jgi:hypothetical protein
MDEAQMMREHLNTADLVEKIKDGSIEAGDLDRVFYRAHKVTIEHTMKILPDTIDYLIKQTMLLRNLSEEFYKNNSDLVNEKGLVKQLLEKVEADNPGMPYDKILDQVSNVARTRLKDLEHANRDSKGKLDIRDLDFKLQKTETPRRGLGEL